MTPIRIRELEAAINRARDQVPATGAEAALSEDVGLMAAIYGELIYRGHSAFDADSLDETTRNALMRWWRPGQSDGPGEMPPG